MGVISSALNSALENLGRATMDVGNNGLLAGYSVWKKCCKITTDYLKVSPVTGGGNAWSIVTGNLFNISMSLECLAPVVPVVIPTSFSIAEGCEKGLGVTRDPACEVVVLEII